MRVRQGVGSSPEWGTEGWYAKCYRRGVRLIRICRGDDSRGRLNVESEQLSLLAGDDEGKGGVGAEGIPEDVSEERKQEGEHVKAENKEENTNHSLVLVVAPFLRPQVFSFVPF